jgi:hypothetical protein
VARDASARLAEQQAAEPVALAPERLHLLEDGVSPRRQHTADDHVPDLAAGVAADDGDRAARSHRATITVLGNEPVDAIYSPDIVTKSSGGSDSATIPSAVVVALFAFLATWPVAKYGFKHDDERSSR